MNTLAEIEAAVEKLAQTEQAELLRFVATRLRSAESNLSAARLTDLHAFEGVLTLREEPMEYQSRARSEWP